MLTQEMQETQVLSLGQEEVLEREMAIHPSILAQKIPWAEESGGLQSMGSQRVRHDWATRQQQGTKIPHTTGQLGLHITSGESLYAETEAWHSQREKPEKDYWGKGVCLWTVRSISISQIHIQLVSWAHLQLGQGRSDIFLSSSLSHHGGI